MYDDIYSSPSDLEYNFDQKYFLNLCKLVGSKNAEELYLDLEVGDEFTELPQKLNKTISSKYRYR